MVTEEERSRIQRIIVEAEDIHTDFITDNLSYTNFLEDVPISKTIPGEETYAEVHVGTQYESKHKGQPIEVFYSPKEDIYVIMNGHHRWAEAKAKGEKTIKAHVNILNEDKGVGVYTTKELEEIDYMFIPVVPYPSKHWLFKDLPKL